jgi:putative N6-adenine-specific DNA methylase
MTKKPDFEIFLVGIPGLEDVVLEEARARGFKGPKRVPGGVRILGQWHDVWRANLELRCATRVLARIGGFHAEHLSDLDRQARKFPWREWLRKDVAVRVETACHKSRIYHSGAATQRIETALVESLGATISDDADLCIKARIDHDEVLFSIDTTGDSLHKRGHKEAIAKAPLRETMAASFLRLSGFTGNETLLDPMCGSGTFVIEAAEMALGLKPGRTREFSFTQLRNFDSLTWSQMKAASSLAPSDFRFYGSDRDKGAISMATANAVRAGVEGVTLFSAQTISALTPPDGPPGLVIVNPPYGTRISKKQPLFDLYAAFGKVLIERFKGWRVSLVTVDSKLAKATKLPFAHTSDPILHGGLKVKLFRTDRLV